MIFHHARDKVFGQRAGLDVLRFLVRGGGSHSGREIARRVGVDPKTCHNILGDLLECGIVDRMRVGAAYLFSLRKDHVLVEKLLGPAFKIERDLLANYAADFLARIQTPVLSLILFGSTVRGEERASSDVDLFAVVATKKEIEKLEEEGAATALDLACRYGNPPQLVVYEIARFRREARKREPFAREVLRTGQVVHGLRLTELVATPKKRAS